MSIREIVSFGVGFALACLTVTLGVFLRVANGGYR